MPFHGNCWHAIIKIDYREGAGIRIAPHFYSTDAELDLTLTTIAAILKDGSWQQHIQGRDFVT